MGDGDHRNLPISKTMRGFLSDLYESGSIQPTATRNKSNNNTPSSTTSTPRRAANTSSIRRTTTTSQQQQHQEQKTQQRRHSQHDVDDRVRRGHADDGPGRSSVVFVTAGASRSGSPLSAISSGVGDDDDEKDEYQYRYNVDDSGMDHRYTHNHRTASRIEDAEETPLAHMAASPFSSSAVRPTQ